MDHTAKGLRVAAANRAAQRNGVHVSMAHADARALVPNLITRPLEARADAQSLRRLALWAQRYSPWTQSDGQDGLVIDITGCTHLFGGQEPLAEDLYAHLTRFGILARIGLADTLAGARAMARYANTATSPARAIHIAPQGQTEQAVRPLPIEALNADDNTTQTLRRVGLSTLGQIIDTPRRALLRRFAKTPGAETILTRIDALTGRDAKPFQPLSQPNQFHARIAFTEPATCSDFLAQTLPSLIQTVSDALHRADSMASRMTVQFCRADGSISRMRIAAASPHANPHQWRTLIMERWSRLDPGFGVDAMLVHARHITTKPPMPSANTPLLTVPRMGKSPCDIHPLVARLAARFHEKDILCAHTGNSWMPERVETLRPIIGHPEHTAKQSEKKPLSHNTGPHNTGPHAPRPITLLDKPEPARVIAGLPDGPPAQFTWRRITHKIIRAEGPERIAPEWWRDIGRPQPARTRDYYRIETQEGRRFWVFREGLYDDETDPLTPEWRVHGIFP